MATAHAPRVALVCICIGEQYNFEYEHWGFRGNQERYAQRHGYAHVLLSDWISAAGESGPSMQKLLVASQSWALAYDIVVLVDWDVYITPHAPPIHESVAALQGRVGAVNEWTQPDGTVAGRLEVQRRLGWHEDLPAYFVASGANVEGHPDTLYNSGVLVIEPRRHAAMLREIYDLHAAASRNHSQGLQYEQANVNAELLVRGAVAPMSQKWNALWVLRSKAPHLPPMRLSEFYAENWFVHHAARYDLNGAREAAQLDARAH